MANRKPLVFVGGEITQLPDDDTSAPTGSAGGVLSGTYPNPAFAQPMATQTSLTAHTSSTANPHNTTKAQVGLGNVDNTSDANKPVSTAQAAANTAVATAAAADATAKANAAQTASTPIAHATNTSNPHATTKAQVGLSNVDNTSDANKPVSLAQQIALDTKVSKVDPAAITSIHSGAVVQAVVYDTSTDSDGGAWRKRSQHTSWYTETLGGDRWIGQQASIAAAWAAADSAAGAVFQASATAGPLTAGRYYRATSSIAATEVFRGITKDFPAVAAIVADATRVIIYDFTQVGCPMWMVFSGTESYAGKMMRVLVNNAGVGLAARDGLLAVTSNRADGGLVTLSFVSEIAANYSNLTAGRSRRVGIATRNVDGLWENTSQVPAIVNSTTTDVAITVLDTAPIDAATGLPVPTIAVATAGGVSVIKDSGTVANNTYASIGIGSVLIQNARLYGTRNTSTGRVISYGPLESFSTGTTVFFDTFISSIPAIPDGGAYKLAGAGAALAAGGQNNAPVLALLKENSSAYAKGMVNYITNTYTSGWMVGDIRGAYLADTVAETITASGEMVTGDSSTFAGGTAGSWTPQGSGDITFSVVGQQLSIVRGSGGTLGRPGLVVSGLVPGRAYEARLTVVSGVGAYSLNGGAGSTGGLSAGNYVAYFIASTASQTILLWPNSPSTTVVFDDIRVRLAEADRSVKNKGLIVNGTLTKAPVASGAGLMAYSGFSAANYLEQPYNPDLDFGTGDYSVMGWIKVPSTGDTSILYRGLDFSSGSPSAGFNFWTYDRTLKTTVAGIALNSPQLVTTGVYNHFVYKRASGVASIYINGALVNTGANAASVTLPNSILTIGRGFFPSASGAGVALFKISATAPNDDQVEHIYRTELPLFQAGAQCAIAGTSTSVTALAYDEVTELLHVGTSWGRTSFHDLTRVDSEATTTGTITSLCAQGGVVLTGGTSANAYIPAMNLRDELRRKDEARKALGKVPVFFDYTATASQTAFVAPKGFVIKAVYQNGTLRRETTTGVFWTRSTDGFRETATLSVGAAASDWISLMCVRA